MIIYIDVIRLKVWYVWFSHRVEHLQNSVLFAGVQSVDDDRQPRLMLREAVDGLRHPRHQLHLVLQDLKVDILHRLTILVTFSTLVESF